MIQTSETEGADKTRESKSRSSQELRKQIEEKIQNGINLIRTVEEAKLKLEYFEGKRTMDSDEIETAQLNWRVSERVRYSLWGLQWRMEKLKDNQQKTWGTPENPVNDYQNMANARSYPVRSRPSGVESLQQYENALKDTMSKLKKEAGELLPELARVPLNWYKMSFLSPGYPSDYQKGEGVYREMQYLGSKYLETEKEYSQCQADHTFYEGYAECDNAKLATEVTTESTKPSDEQAYKDWLYSNARANIFNL